MKTLRHIIDEHTRAGWLWAAALVSFIISKWIQLEWLDKSYVASKFPVPFYVGQTTFNAQETKSHYQFMLDQGTLGIYYQTQLIDFAFIAASFVFTLMVMAAIYKSFKKTSSLRKFAWWMLVIMPFAAVMDALENGVSFFMLANPTGFPDWLILPYSSFAALKFILFATGYLWIIIAIILYCVQLLVDYTKS